jgi:hypothetical protein
MSSFRIKYSELNNLNLQDLSASLGLTNIPQTTFTQLTPTVLNNLVTNPIQVIPAPTVTGQYIIIEAVTASMIYNGQAYTGSPVLGLYYGITGTTNTSTSSGISNFLTLITSTGNIFGYQTNGLFANKSLNVALNSPIYLIGKGTPFSNGNSTVNLTTQYQVFNS